MNGEYHEDPEDNDYYRGIIWELWKGDYSLKSAKMMIQSPLKKENVAFFTLFNLSVPEFLFRVSNFLYHVTKTAWFLRCHLATEPYKGLY